MPAIDPFSVKNKELTAAEMDDRLDQYKIPVDLPLVVQVSRFDRWKDPQGVAEAFKLAQKEVDANGLSEERAKSQILAVLGQNAISS